MQKNLVIVESPAKAKTIEKFLGKDFKVLSSYGHIRDLKKKDFSIDIENNFKPFYEIPKDKEKLVNELKKEASNSEMVWLASDEDREGEAIAWHLYEVLNLDPDNTKRIVFHEITKTAILNAIENPRGINFDLVDAQQARRVLDRIVGFELSPILWRKVKPSLSAGRVQSVAVRLIVEREREIRDFKSEPYYRVIASFIVPNEQGKDTLVKAELNKRLLTKEQVVTFLESCKGGHFTISSINKRPVKKSPSAPFTTSTLQQEAARKLGYTVAQTMMVAQRLYEAGHITYMRTDSVNLSKYAVEGCKQAVTNLMGEEYYCPRHYDTKSKGAQEAHEAIRPTYMDKTSVSGSNQEKRLYDLIWKRTLASQMANAELEKTTATISVDTAEEQFVAVGEIITFDGFLKVYRESYDDEEENENENASAQPDESKLLPPLKKGQVLSYDSIIATERFSKRPARYTEASLVRKLEELGIGRPSTYAPTISTIQNRQYVEKGNREGEEKAFNILTLKQDEISDQQAKEIVGAEKSKLFPTDIGSVVNDFLTEYFPDILDYNFTATVEKQFDEVAHGKAVWTNILGKFYTPFHQLVTKISDIKMDHKVGERILGNDPKTGRQISVKIGRYGPVVQMGIPDEEEKPKFAQVRKGYSIETLTLEDALELFKLPRDLGEFEDSEVSIGVGRFGPYVKHNKKFVSLPKDLDPLKVTLQEAIDLVIEKRAKDAKMCINHFEEEDLKVLNGRFGPYISYDGANYKIPKDIVPEDLTLQACLELVKAQKDKKGTRKRKTTTKKATTKKATTKKTADKKTSTAKTKKTTTAKKTTKKSTSKKESAK